MRDKNDTNLFILILVFLILVVVYVFTTGQHATTNIQPTPSAYAFLSTDFVKSQIIEQANAHHTNAEQMVAVAGCESGWRWNAVGDYGHSIGVFQLHDRGLAIKFYQRFHSRFNTFEQAVFAAEEFAAGRWTQWSCAWMIQGRMPPWWYGVWGGR